MHMKKQIFVRAAASAAVLILLSPLLAGAAAAVQPDVSRNGSGASADAAWNTGALEALKEAVAAQGQRSGVRWADALSITVRPVITYWFMALYCAAKMAAFVAAVTAGAGWGTAILHAWTEADQALWAGVLNFWFIGRVFDRVKP